MPSPLAIDVFADLVCPWCYVGERRLEQALAEHPDLDVAWRWHPFQLRPDMPTGGRPWAAFAEEKFGGAERAAAAFAQVERVGAEDGLTFNFDRVTRAPNTVDAHRLVLWAAEQGRAQAMAHALFAAYFAEGRDLNDADDLADAAAEAGFDAAALRAVLAGAAQRAAVQASQDEATRLGVTGVPLYVIGERRAVSGAQPAAHFGRVLDAALADEVGEA